MTATIVRWWISLYGLALDTNLYFTTRPVDRYGAKMKTVKSTFSGTNTFPYS